MNQEKNVLQLINKLITHITPNASQNRKQEVNDYCKRMFSSMHTGQNQSAQQLKDKIINKVSAHSDSKTVLGCQETINRLMTETRQRKPLILKFLLKSSEHNNKGKSIYCLHIEDLSHIFNNQSKIQALNQTQETTYNVSAVNTMNNNSSNGNIFRQQPYKSIHPPQQIKNYRGSNQQGISQNDILTQITYCLQNIDANFIKFEVESDSFNLLQNINVNEAVRSIVGQLCEIGWLYKKITSSLNDKGTIWKSLYLAVQEELTEYFRWLAIIQNMIKKNELSLRKLVMWSYEPLQKLKWLNIVLQSVQNYSGCLIISAINSFRPQGNNVINEFLNRLLSHLVQPLLQFIHNWMYKGELIDDYKQFFVQQKSKVKQIFEWYQKYSLVQTNIPNILDRQSAIMIFNAGKTIYFLKNRCKCNYSIQIPFLNHQQILNKDIYESSDILSIQFKKWLKAVYQDLSSKLVTELKEKFHLKYHLESMKHFYLMGKGDFIQHLIDTLKDQMIKPKHQIYQNTLDGYINDAMAKSFQDFRLDGKSQILPAQMQNSRNGIEQGGQKMFMMQRSNISNNSKNKIDFDNSYRANIIERLLAKKVDFGENAWDSFNFQYSMDKIQPLYSILTPEFVTKYQAIFQFLWRIKRVQHVLKQIWMIHQKQYPKAPLKKNISQFSKILHRCHILRTNMSHFLNNFYGYLMIAIQSAWDRFSASVQKSLSLDEIIKEHQKLHFDLSAITFASSQKKSLLESLTKVLKSMELLKIFQTKVLNDYSEFSRNLRDYDNRKKIVARGLLSMQQEQLQIPYFDQTDLNNRFQQINLIYAKSFRDFYINLKKQGQQASVLVFRLDFSEFFAKKQLKEDQDKKFIN